MVKHGYGISDISTFTVGEFICRAHAVVYGVEMERIEKQMRSISGMAFASRDSKDIAFKGLRDEMKEVQQRYDYLLID